MPEPTPDMLPALAEVIRRAELENREVRVRPPSAAQGYWEVSTRTRPVILKRDAPKEPGMIYSGRASDLERAAVYCLSEWPDTRELGGGIGRALFEGKAF